MDKSSIISTMQKLHFGRKICCSDGEEGTLTHVGFDPAVCRMTFLGVKPDRLFSKTVYLPFDTVVGATSGGVSLRIARAELATASKEEPVGAFLDHRSVVECDAAKGRLLMTAVEPESGELAFLVAHHICPRQDTLLRREFVSKIETGRVVLSLSDVALQSLPAYRSDRELQREVEDILFDLAPLHVDFKGMTIRVLDSILYLDGNISSGLRADIVEDQASGIQGLLDIKNRLIGDDRLAADIALALGRDERTCNLSIGVYPRLGVVRLSGAVYNEQEKSVAEEITRKLPGVRSVNNDLVLDSHAAMLLVMSAVDSGEAADNVPGKYVRHTQ